MLEVAGSATTDKKVPAAGPLKVTTSGPAGVAVLVGVGVLVFVAVGVGVLVFVAVGVGVLVFVAVGTGVFVFVAVGTGVLVAVPGAAVGVRVLPGLGYTSLGISTFTLPRPPQAAIRACAPTATKAKPQ